MLGGPCENGVFLAAIGKTAHSSLLERIAAGDAAAVRACVSTYGGLVWSLARRHLSNEADAEEAVQDAFMSLWKSADRFDPDRAEEATFVAMIARRRIIDRARKRGRSAPSDELTEIAVPARAEEASDARRAPVFERGH
ncbi:MAG: sigma-70 family RNA polymerase sigma factor [Myxococcota bacterium]